MKVYGELTYNGPWPLMTSMKKTRKDIIASVWAGQEFEVTNHYITRPDHPCYGTRRAIVERVNSGAITLNPGGRSEWPKKDQIEQDGDGTIRLYGGGIGQRPDELFLTLRPVKP